VFGATPPTNERRSGCASKRIAGVIFASTLISPTALLFAFVFGASIATGGGASYREFLLPGIQAQTIVFTAFVVASGITADVEKGIVRGDFGRG